MRHCGESCDGRTCEPCPVREAFESDLIPMDTHAAHAPGEDCHYCRLGDVA